MWTVWPLIMLHRAHTAAPSRLTGQYKVRGWEASGGCTASAWPLWLTAS